jgi:hypothetical protein
VCSLKRHSALELCEVIVNPAAAILSVSPCTMGITSNIGDLKESLIEINKNTPQNSENKEKEKRMKGHI